MSIGGGRYILDGLIEGGFSDQPLFSAIELVALMYDCNNGFSDQSIFLSEDGDSDDVMLGSIGGFWSRSVLRMGVEGSEDFKGLEGMGGESSLSFSSSDASSIAQQASRAFDTFHNTFWCITSGRVR
jgi:hypothetical protein